MDDGNRNTKLDAELIELIPALRNFARRFYASPNDIDDLVQETIVKALANLDKFEEGTRLKSWLFTIMRNAFCTRFGLAKRERAGLGEAPDYRISVQPHQEWTVRGHELETAIAKLPERYRTAIEVVFIQGVSYEEAAKQFGCPIGTIKSRVNRARERIVNQLGD
ncbi:RNA polymerase subunit sigma [Rhizobium sp. JAB6]|jgi:RNA polymerase sigma-70 factor (ECF subfamily)|uniref:sigma-70 family RNA polymerase sigma factor n=1 Tax=Rhizobium sp. JAB6 TaxID=2127050 RepID=UPI000D12473D|nr:sigma-70 family RNA polymerase sigma factor [Rhizobium sp. JAB6]PST19305.1 RNA polymerase subunit sigma [Rhizobium sp. JAB6]